MTDNPNYKYAYIFNSPLEIGLRALILINSGSPQKYDLQTLIYYDYFMLYSGDLGNEEGASSIHPNIPYRFGEIIVRRKVMQDGLDLMYSKGLIEIIYDSDGISYISSQLTLPFLELFQSSYYQQIKSSAEFIINYFNNKNENLDTFIKSNIKNWGGEFIYEAFVRGDDNE